MCFFNWTQYLLRVLWQMFSDLLNITNKKCNNLSYIHKMGWIVEKFPLIPLDYLSWDLPVLLI